MGTIFHVCVVYASTIGVSNDAILNATIMNRSPAYTRRSCAGTLRAGA